MSKTPYPLDNQEQSSHVNIGTVFGGMVNSIIAGGDVSVNAFTGSEELRRQRNRQAMLQLVRTTWVEGVLEQSLHGAAMIELGMEERADAVERPWDTMVQMLEGPRHQLPCSTRIVDVFDEMNRSLLILGEPGAGKTTMLLELASDTIERAEGDVTEPIPVVFNLSSWAEKRLPIAEWLVEELNTKYLVPKKMARGWVENDELLLLLDGLDEVRLTARDACIETLKHFRTEHMAAIVVCSRISEYEALRGKLNFHGAVMLQPLTDEQIDRHLAGTGTLLLAVRQTLQHDSTLRELAQSPLMLSILMLAFRELSLDELRRLDSTAARRDHVFQAYVRCMLQRVRASRVYSPQRTVRSLIWLARNMCLHGQSLFLPEGIQPTWLTLKQENLYLALFALFLLPCGFVLGSGRVSFRKVQVAEALTWSTSRAMKEVASPVALIVLAVFAVLIGLISSLTQGIGAGLVIGLSIVVIFGMMIAIMTGLDSRDLMLRSSFNQGVWRSARNALVAMGPGSLLTAGLWLASESYDAFRFCAMISLMLTLHVGVMYGGGAFVQHFILRFILCCAGATPWRYKQFLDHATERIFLRKAGGGYMFVHRLLMEYFATLAEPDVVS